MVRKSIAIIAGLYFLTLLQASFFVHFFDYSINLVLIAVILMNFFEEQDEGAGIVAGIAGGLFLDVFFSDSIGRYLAICVLSAIFVKYFVRSYVRRT